MNPAQMAEDRVPDTLDWNDSRYWHLLVASACAQFSFWSSFFAFFAAMVMFGEWLGDRPVHPAAEMVRVFYGTVIVLWLLMSFGFTAFTMWRPSKRPGETWEDVLRMNWNMAYWGNPLGLLLLGPWSLFKKTTKGKRG